ncbi:hypothetical protein [Mycobacterium sp. OTB74]|jgi:hypothetical protein|nr:hypothetical protein [Mycobacterium sp. OTB74]MDH6247751.1 hypothetical protein [Mycobacterium sp. OTB74]
MEIIAGDHTAAAHNDRINWRFDGTGAGHLIHESIVSTRESGK